MIKIYFNYNTYTNRFSLCDAFTVTETEQWTSNPLHRSLRAVMSISFEFRYLSDWLWFRPSDMILCLLTDYPMLKSLLVVWLVKVFSHRVLKPHCLQDFWCGTWYLGKVAREFLVSPDSSVDHSTWHNL